MKKITYILTFLLIVTSISINAQRGKKERIKALKIAHITEQLNLTEVEAQKFWPIYNKFDSKLMELRMEERMNIKKRIKELGGLEVLKDNDAKEILTKIVAIEKSIFETKQEFHKKLSKVISYKKILKLEIAEKDFHRKLLRKFRDRRPDRKKIKE